MSAGIDVTDVRPFTAKRCPAIRNFYASVETKMEVKSAVRGDRFGYFLFFFFFFLFFLSFAPNRARSSTIFVGQSGIFSAGRLCIIVIYKERRVPAYCKNYEKDKGKDEEKRRENERYGS